MTFTKAKLIGGGGSVVFLLSCISLGKTAVSLVTVYLKPTKGG